MDIQRLRSLTTGRLHTEIGHVYEDIEHLTGVPGVMTHQIPNVMRAIKPWLRGRVQEERFWNGEYDTSHVGEYDIAPMTDEEREQMLLRYGALPSPLEGKDVRVVFLDE